jgi:hypothetical protein
LTWTPNCLDSSRSCLSYRTLRSTDFWKLYLRSSISSKNAGSKASSSFRNWKKFVEFRRCFGRQWLVNVSTLGVKFDSLRKVSLGPVYMRPGRSQTEMKIEPTCLHETGTMTFRWLLLACVVPMSRLQPRPVSLNVFLFTFIPIWIHASSEVSRLGPASGMTWERSELFSSRSHVNIYYK